MFQLQLISPLFMVPFKYSPKFGYLFNFALVFIIGFVNIFVKLVFGPKLLPFEITEIHSLEDHKYALNRYITIPDQYLSLFIIGVIFGYFLRNRQTFDNFVRKRFIRLFIGILCYSTTVLILVWNQTFRRLDQKPNKLSLNLWFGFAKIFWSFGNLWLIYDIYSRNYGLTLFQILPLY